MGALGWQSRRASLSGIASTSLDPRVRPWFDAALNAKPSGRIAWTEAYSFFQSGETRITAALAWSDPGDPSRSLIVSVDVLLTEISRFTTNLAVSKRGVAAVIEEDGSVVGSAA